MRVVKLNNGWGVVSESSIHTGAVYRTKKDAAEAKTYLETYEKFYTELTDAEWEWIDLAGSPTDMQLGWEPWTLARVAKLAVERGIAPDDEKSIDAIKGSL
jgi:hypothetical protein